MPKKEEKEFIEDILPQLINDPYALMKQQNEALLLRMEMLEQQTANLQETWNRILNVAQEPLLRQPQQPFMPFQQQQYQQQFQPPSYQNQVQASYQNQGCYPPESVQQQPVDNTDKPRWEKQIAEPVEAKPKRKLGRGTLLIIGAVALVIIAYIFMKIMQGYTIHIPGG